MANLDNSDKSDKSIEPIINKRGRKPKKLTEENIKKPTPKKRGRKPKQKNVSEEPHIPKKRGRKPKGKVVNYIKNFEIPSTDNICNNIITNLPIKMDELLTNDNENSSESEKDINTIFTSNHDNTINLFTQS